MWAGLGRLKFTGRSALLCVCLSVVAGAILPLAYSYAADAGLFSAMIAFVLCLASGVLALGIVDLIPNPSQKVFGVLAGMLVRMGLPLMIAMMLVLLRPEMQEAGFLFYLLAFYMSALAVETLLMVSHVQALVPTVTVKRSAKES